MNGINVLKQKLFAKLEKLPEDCFAEVLDFVSYLLSKAEKTPSKKRGDLDPDNDPILNFIGGISNGSLAKDIDKEIYGS